MTSASVCGWQAVVAAACCCGHVREPAARRQVNSPPNVIDGAELLEALRGGYVLLRHGDHPDHPRLGRTSLANCATQRPVPRGAGR